MRHYSFSLDYLPDASEHHNQGTFCFFEGNQLVEVGAEPGILSSYEDLKQVEVDTHQHPVYIGGYAGKRYFALELKEGTSERYGLATQTMRHLGHQDEELFALLSRGLQLLHWRRNHKHCGRCGSETRPSQTEHAMICPNCNLSFYPKIMPCIMALVVRGDTCLLAKHANRGTGVFSALAGFIEAGESVEHAIRREVLEEVGIKTGEISYFSSQAWPFPGQLMLGFFAQYLEGEIIPEEGEIEEARWFRADDLPAIPEAFSLSGQLIRAFAKAQSR